MRKAGQEIVANPGHIAEEAEIEGFGGEVVDHLRFHGFVFRTNRPQGGLHTVAQGDVFGIFTGVGGNDEVIMGVSFPSGHKFVEQDAGIQNDTGLIIGRVRIDVYFADFRKIGNQMGKLGEYKGQFLQVYTRHIAISLQQGVYLGAFDDTPGQPHIERG